jgi:GDP-4-dehydro-6-deoxy-D-mannose reductase
VSSVLITGAAGFAGSHLLDVLAADGADIVAWHRPGNTRTSPRHNVVWEAIDLMDRRAVGEAIRRRPPTAVYHCAGAAHVGRAWDDSTPTLAVNVRGTQALIEALAAAAPGVPVLVPSSAMIYEPAREPIGEEGRLVPSNPYGVSKLAQEMLARRAARDGIEPRVARAFNHVGPRQDPSFAASGFAKQIAEIEAGQRDPEIFVGNLDARREMTDVRDTVRAYRTILEYGRTGRPYNVCSGRAVPVGEVLEGLVTRAGVPVRVRVDPARLRPNDLPILAGDPSRIQTELGWTPSIPLDQTLDDLLNYWRVRVASRG